MSLLQNFKLGKWRKNFLRWFFPSFFAFDEIANKHESWSEKKEKEKKAFFTQRRKLKKSWKVSMKQEKRCLCTLSVISGPKATKIRIDFSNFLCENCQVTHTIIATPFQNSVLYVLLFYHLQFSLMLYFLVPVQKSNSVLCGSLYPLVSIWLLWTNQKKTDLSRNVTPIQKNKTG